MNKKIRNGAIRTSAAGTGAATGIATGIGLLNMLGTPGLGAAGITSGLAALGTVLGGGMLAGIGVAAVPAVVLGIGAHTVARKLTEENRKYK